MQEFGCHSKGGIALGEKDGLPYSAVLQHGADGDEILLRFAVDSGARALASRLKKEELANVRWFAENGKDGQALVALFTPPSEFYVKSGLHHLLHTLSQLKKEGGITPPAVCPLCGLGGCDSNAYLDDDYRPVHAACVKTRLKLPEDDQVIPARAGGNIFTGILGAFLGAVIASLPIFTFALNDGVLHWVLYAFIPILSALCYRLLRGRASSTWAGLLVLASSLLCAFVLELLWFWVLLSAQYQQTVAFAISLQRYFASHSFALTVREMLTCLLALLAGYMAASVLLRRYVQDGGVPRQVVRGAAFTRSTLVPLGWVPEKQDDAPAPEK